MTLSFIGMSGSGKTYWAKKLEAAGFKRYSCDDMIEQKLESELEKLGYRGIHDLAKWLGQPFEPQYLHNSKRYLELELECMEETFALIKQTNQKNTIIDTTGSFIYMPQAVQRELQSLSQVVFLSTPAMVQKEMFEQYIVNPKPVIWGACFHKLADEANNDALKRSYPDLLKYRTEQYKQLAHSTMSYFLLRNNNFTCQEFIERIQSTYDQL